MPSDATRDFLDDFRRYVESAEAFEMKWQPIARGLISRLADDRSSPESVEFFQLANRWKLANDE